MLNLVKVTEHAKKIWLAQVHWSRCQYADMVLRMTPTKIHGTTGKEKSHPDLYDRTLAKLRRFCALDKIACLP